MREILWGKKKKRKKGTVIPVKKYWGIVNAMGNSNDITLSEMGR